MFSTDDTIVAIATPPGRGGIGVVRVSGRGSASIARALTGRSTLRAAARHAHHASSSARRAIDQAVVTYFPAPHSYTGEDVVELSAHGSPGGARSDRRAPRSRPARGWPARASSRFARTCTDAIDLVQAEAVAELIDAVTPLQARVAFDQLEGTLTTRLSARWTRRCWI